MWNEVQECNALRAKLGESPWFYAGDVEAKCGGIATTVNRLFGYATIVELVELWTATDNAAGLVMIERGTVVLDRANLASRRRMRSGMSAMGLTMAQLIKDYPGEQRWKVMAEIGRALWVYGYADRDRETVICFDPEAAKDNDPSVWAVSETVPESGLTARFIEELYS